MSAPSRPSGPSPSDRSISLKPGDLIADRYEVQSTRGFGGMGTVFEARDRRTNRVVALKVLHPEYALEPEWRKRFVREARAAAAIHHPNIVGVLDVDVHGPHPFLAMDLLDGETLAERIARERFLPLLDAAKIFIPVLGAIAAAHDAGVVHRDLKPENVYIVTSKGREIPYVLDFGIAKVSRDLALGETNAALTQTGAMLGTPYFMAPEQMLNEDAIDHRIDVWALGVILYLTLSGSRPYAGSNLAQILKSVLTTTPRRLDELVPGMPADVVEIVHAALSVKKEQRPDRVEVISAVFAPYAGVSPPIRTSPVPVRDATPSLTSLESGETTPAITPVGATPPEARTTSRHGAARRASSTAPAETAKPQDAPRRPWLAISIVVAAIGIITAVVLTRGGAPPQQPAQAASSNPPLASTPVTAQPTPSVVAPVVTASAAPSPSASIAKPPKPPLAKTTASVVPSATVTTAPSPTTTGAKGIVEKPPF